MKRKSILPELLAPAGDMECLYAAVMAGADAIYIGGHAFGARAYAKNFSIEEIKQAASYCHLRGAKLYVTLNTLIFDKEIHEASDFAVELWHAGVDAIIVADLGIIREIRRRVPKMKIHASTQASVHNTAGANILASLGCERVVLARELSYENILSVTEKCGVETEIFLHGALCVSHSGQCLMSSMIGGRSGNRGECAQPCRLPYNNGKYPLSLSDLSLADHVTELISSGVASLKIEGRMKSPEYVYTVTSIYRSLLDEQRNATAEEKKRLKNVFSRGEFTDGYFKGSLGGMTGVRSEKDKENTRTLGNMTFAPLRTPVKAKVRIVSGEHASLTLTHKDKSVTAYGPVPTAAISSPLTEEGVAERLMKMGQTLLSLDRSDISVTLEEGLNLPPSAINSLRRDAAASMEYSGREETVKDFEPENLDASCERLFTAEFLSGELYSAIINADPELLRTLDIIFLPIESYLPSANGVSLPPIITDSEEEGVKKLLKSAKEKGVKYALVSNLGHLDLAKEQGLIPIGNFRLNVTNSLTRAALGELGIKTLLLSPELTLPMQRDIGGGVITYGRIPLMLTERCFIKESFGCEKCGSASLRDRKGSSFPMIYQYGHRNVILNSLPTYMGDKKEELEREGISHTHLLFSVESCDEAIGTVKAYFSGIPLACPTRRIGARLNANLNLQKEK
jgi:putative protease